MDKEFGIGNRIIDIFSGLREGTTKKPSIFNDNIENYSLKSDYGLEIIKRRYKKSEHTII